MVQAQAGGAGDGDTVPGLQYLLIQFQVPAGDLEVDLTVWGDLEVDLTVWGGSVVDGVGVIQ